jgi:K+-sensing histidine kinase KdpD
MLTDKLAGRLGYYFDESPYEDKYFIPEIPSFDTSVITEGIGIDENIDVFAPFKKVGKENGVGLGLYLAKIASDALNAKISIKNREDGKNGAIAKLELNL